MDSESNVPQGNERERYVLGYSDKVLEWLRRRSVKTHAPFLLPHLHSGMRGPRLARQVVGRRY